MMTPVSAQFSLKQHQGCATRASGGSPAEFGKVIADETEKSAGP
jgi:hypothetical protein